MSVYDLVLRDGEALDDKLITLHDDRNAHVLTGGTIIDGTGRTLTGSLVICGERIVGVMPAQAAARDYPTARVFDCTGQTILPGLFDLHVHLMGTSEQDRFLSYVSPSPGIRVLRQAFDAYTTLAHGVTTARSLGHGDSDHTFGLRESIAEGIVRGPRIYHVGWAMAPTDRHEPSPLPWPMFRELRTTLWAHVDGEAELRALLRENAADGADATKIYLPPHDVPGEAPFTPEELRVIVDESHRLGRRVAVHVKTVRHMRMAVEAGVDCMEHGPDEVDEDLLKLMADRGTYLVPTLAVYNRVSEVADEFGYPQAMVDSIRRELEGRMRNVLRARELGIRVGVGSDVGARGGFGYMAVKELDLLVETGFTPMQALTAATGVSADVLGVANELGTIAGGKLAEVVVVDGDPLNDISVLQQPASIRHIFQAAGHLDPLQFPSAVSIGD
jgi:imidazolonepropionase-like amidohydrolase